jgi:CheY-like chemotaxis protein
MRRSVFSLYFEIKRETMKKTDGSPDMKRISDKIPWQELDSFFDARIAMYLSEDRIAREVCASFVNEGFSRAVFFNDSGEFIKTVLEHKFDLIILDLSINNSGMNGYHIVEQIRAHDVDVQIITISEQSGETSKKVDFVIHHHFKTPFLTSTLIRASKKALGDKANYEIGMQFFNALFGMQMCTHRDLHQRTFDHVIRTTKVYGKFLLFLNRRGYVELNSWVFKNFLMASLVHDIGKLLVMHGILYKDGKLTNFEYEQVKRHPWNSITALLGGYDIDFFAKGEIPLKSVSGYNDKNLGAQVRQWIYKILDNDLTALEDVDGYFSELSKKPFIHSLNFDLLYIVFRHHDRVEEPYLSENELSLFGKILGRSIHTRLSEKSPLDVVTNALTLCDMYDALLDMTRDYRKASYCVFLALFVLYNEMKRGGFFPFLAKEFIRFVIEHETIGSDQPFAGSHDVDKAIAAIENLSSLFQVTRDQESDFNDFILDNRIDIEKIAPLGITDELRVIHQRWIDFYDVKYRSMVDHFMNELKSVGLLSKEIADFSIHEIKTFDMLYRCYFSFSSSYKQRKLIEFLVHAVIKVNITGTTAEKIAKLITEERPATRGDLEKLLIDRGYDRTDLFEVFLRYDENTLINELNDYLGRHT